MEDRKPGNNGTRSDNQFGIDVFDDNVNPTPRCACAILLDVSASMEGDPIDELNGAVKTFFEELLADDFARFSVEPAVITFGGHEYGTNDSEARVVRPFTSLADGREVTLPTFTASGLTPMGAAIRTGLELLDERKEDYRRQGIPYFQPWMVLLTDGAPTDNWKDAAQMVRERSDERKLVFLGVGVGPDVDMNTLGEICPAKRPPKRMRGIRFRAFFEWLSQSMSAVSQSSPGAGTIKTPPIDAWAEIDI